MKKLRYKIVCGDKPTVEQEVNLSLEDGWELVGSAKVSVEPPNFWFYQTMVIDMNPDHWPAKG